MTTRGEKKAPDPAARRKGVLERLGSYQKYGHFSGDKIPLGHAFAHESDRAVVIICGALIEDMLTERVIRAMPSGDEMRKDLTRPGAPLNSFAATTAIALAMGLIDEGTGELLEVLKAMRNACAHSRKDIDFATPELKEALKLLLGGDTLKLAESTNNRMGLRFLFINVISYLQNLVRGLTPRQASERAEEVFELAWKAITSGDETDSGQP